MKKLKILCIDDSKAVHAFLADCLDSVQQEVHHVYNGQEAVDYLRDRMNYFDLIFLDWEMPVKDGPTTFAELKAAGLKTPVFMLTSKNDPLEIMQMIESGVAEYLLKPFTRDIILDKISSTIG
jgi:two-component system, chemotaxis family, chemotaxis protein CheY